MSIATIMSACAGAGHLPTGPGAIPTAAAVPARGPVDLEEYRIGPRDVLMVSVFNEPNLSFEDLPVSSGGTISLPLIGILPAAGKTAAELSDDINNRLNARYLRRARTAVSVKTATNYTVTIDGAVTKAGIYDIPGRLMLSQSLALAGGGSQFAKLSEVVVIRDIGEQRYAARFNMKDIRDGRAPDFPLKQGDTVVVGFNYLSSFFQNAIATLPAAAALFVAVRR